MRYIFFYPVFTTVLLAAILITGQNACSAVGPDPCSTIGYNESLCLSNGACMFCPVQGDQACQLASVGSCIECSDLAADPNLCALGNGCYWCPNKFDCLPDGVSCTCGDSYLLNTEECDSGLNCAEDCTCITGTIPDGIGGCCDSTGCVINGDCIPADEKRVNAGQCQVCDPGISQTEWTTVACSCGDGLVSSGENCDNPADANCVDCICTNNSIPDGGTGCCAGCLIDNSCIGTGEINPNDKCQTCDPETLQTGWTSGDCFNWPLFLPAINGKRL